MFKFIFMKKIYLDYAATTPVDKNVLKAMQPFFQENFGNPSSINLFGQNARIAIDQARYKIARILNCEFDEIIFTSSATEANNLALKGTAFYFLNKKHFRPHFISTNIEHKSVLKTLEDLKDFNIETSYLKVNKDGLINPRDLANVIKDSTVLVSVNYVNSEIGAVQPIKEIAGILKDINIIRLKNGLSKIFLHIDAVQAANYITIDIKELNIDLMTLSSHKIYGPKGIGLLYKAKKVNISALISGGDQEFGLRSSTENVPAIIGFSKALEINEKIKSKESQRIKKLRDYLIEILKKKIPFIEINGTLKERIPNNLNFSIKGITGQTLLIALDQEGIAVSTGTACLSNSQEPSYVLLALGKNNRDSYNSLRITLGRDTIKEDLEKFVESLYTIVKRFKSA